MGNIWYFSPVTGKIIFLDQTISGIETKLNPAQFFKINRKFIISYNSIKEMVKYSNSRIKIVLTPVPPAGIEAIVSSERNSRVQTMVESVTSELCKLKACQKFLLTRLPIDYLVVFNLFNFP